MSKDDSTSSHASVDLLARVRQNDPQAAEELFHRYLSRLIGLVRTRLSPQLAQRIDAEDVVQSAYRSFFAHAQDGRYTLKRSGDLWRLLAAIAINKLGKQIERHRAAKRDMGAERRLQGADDSLRGVTIEAIAAEPTPDQVAQIVDEMQLLMSDLDATQQKILELRLQGYRVEEIATEVQRSERTVRRLLEKVKQRLEERLARFAED